MQTIIMTVGTSLLTNSDKELINKRPWNGQKTIGDHTLALEWMSQTELELISAETNTLWRLDPNPNDEIIMLYSDTPSGLECAEVLQKFLQINLDQQNVSLCPIPGIHYELDESGSALERMASLLKKLIAQPKGNITLAATGGFKAQTMVMALVGNICGVPVCYVHEQYKALVYLPYLSNTAQPTTRVRSANLPDSGVPRSSVIHVQDDSQGHHRPKVWKKVEKMLQEIPWVDYVRFDNQAFSAAKNGVKAATRKTQDGRYVLWIHLHESQQSHMAISLETTGHTPEHLEQAAAELRQRLGSIV
ncbi:MAG: putative CRISPR-associated protein [Scytonema sp. PMC 1069.18]|nr:putative CRISPR-associated protein [Scytonema sp. PMC 1069.18]MEC4884120.1 putative CRISPR-associated protein [Scytonema sp. PMC 1070.18]